jgi:small-conductance mechanosensitive channel
MNVFDQTYFGNTLNIWIVALGAGAVSTLLLFAAKKILVSRIGAFAKTTETILDDLFVNLIAGTRPLSIMTLSLYLGLSLLVLPPGVEKAIERIAVLAFLVQGILWGSSLIRYWLDSSIRKRMEGDASGTATITAIAFVLKLALWSIAVLLALDNLGFNITTLVAGLGIGGIAIALAVQNVLGDVFASLSIVLDKPFVVGDFIVVDEHLGAIEYIGLKTTRIRSLSGEQIVFSNSELLKSRIRNFKRMAERRVVFKIGVTYDTPQEKLNSIGHAIKEIIQSQEHTRLDRVHFKEFGDSALVFEAVYYVLSAEYNLYMDIQEAINFLIIARFRADGIEFAFPTMTIVRPDVPTMVRGREESHVHNPSRQLATNDQGMRPGPSKKSVNL